MKYYSLSEKGFFDDEVHGDNKPEDCVQLTDAEYADLLQKLNSGKVAKLVDGHLETEDPVIDPVEHNKQMERRRLIDYTNEADPLFYQYQREEVTKQVWLDKIAEIKARWPYI